jgi:molybdate transport system substrate-binding protein
MKLATLAATAVLAMATVTAAPTTGRTAEIRLICSNGYHAVIDVLGPQYEKATGHKLVVSYGLAAALQKDIEGGAPFDITILAPPQIDALVKQGKIVADTRTVLAKSGMGVMVRTGAPKPDVSTVDAFKKTLLAASRSRFRRAARAASTSSA